MTRSNPIDSATRVRIDFRPQGNGSVTDHLTRIHIKNFRSCHDVSLDGLGDITAFVGRNGVGKTNILKAIEWASRVATTPHQTLRQRNPTSVELEFCIKGKSYCYLRALAVVASADRKRRVHVLKESVRVLSSKNEWKDLIVRDEEKMTIEGHKEIQIAPHVPCLQAVFSLFPQSNAIVKHAINLMTFFDGVRYFPLDEVSEPTDMSDAIPVISEKEYQAWAATLDTPESTSDSVCLQILHLWLTDKPAFQELQDLLGDSGVGLIDEIVIQVLSVDVNASDTESAEKPKTKHYYLNFRLSARVGASGRELHQFSHLSVGTRRIIRLLVAVLTGETTIALIEHPEDAIHSGMVKKLMGILSVNSNRRQMLIASHSPQVFNILKPEQIRFVWMEPTGTAVRSLTQAELAAAESFICNEGPLSEFLESIQED